jgi:hypothetical protein
MPTKFVITAAGAALLLAQPAFVHHPFGVANQHHQRISTRQGETAARLPEWIK